MCHEITARKSFIMYAVTLDYKGLPLLWAKIIDEKFMLGGTRSECGVLFILYSFRGE